MKNGKIFLQIRKSAVFIICLIFLSTVFSALIAFNILRSRSPYMTSNSARIETKSAIDYIESGFKEKDFSKLDEFEFKTEIIDLNGHIIYDNFDNAKGNVDIDESVGYDFNFSYINRNIVKYSVPVVIKGSQAGIAIFFIDKNYVSKNNSLEETFFIILPFLISGFIISIRLLFSIKSAKKEVIIPINDLNKSSEAIMRGNFKNKIKYNSETEIGRLCANFEKMRDELECSIEREKKLESSRKELITCISHDLRTPISSIKAYVDGIKDGMADDPETLNRYLNVIGRKTEILAKLIDDLFEHCQAELEKLKIEKKEVYSGEFLKHVSDELKLELENSGYEFEVSQDMPDVLINIDSSRIEQVINNLVQNSRKYTPKGGKIMLQAEIEDNCLKISIKDNGYGIDNMDIPYIFDKFYRGEKMRGSDPGGSGLGLSICKYIVEKHDGQIFVESKKGKGSSFYFIIPKI